MKAYSFLTLLCLLLLFSFGCAPSMATKPQPDDFSLRYRWSEGALPPPYHYEYTIHLGPGRQGRIEFWPDYPSDDTPVWTETFELGEGELEKLYSLLAAQGLLEEKERPSQGAPPGASTGRLQVTMEGRQISLPGALDDTNQAEAVAVVTEAVKAQVPEPIWTKLMAQYEQYQQEFENG